MLATLLLTCASSLAIETREPVERGWSALIASRTETWVREVPALSLPFSPICGPESVRVVVSNQGEDAFTPDPRTIQFNAARLLALYGDPGLAENRDRIDRFFRHEYTHLLQKAWLAEHPYRADTPIRRALAEIWGEGLGNYYSLSARWRGVSDTAVRTRGELEPRFVARVAALACASDDIAAPLVADLSNGPFDQKWGALPAALWLEAELKDNPDALRNFAAAGPDGIWALAGRHLADPLKRALAEAQQAMTRCQRR
jgi:hypothetical protein